ncbi:hypothetical protein TNCV_836481 [Trichonephila clavipes]|nr:hypothetical protein TNCV_836481 [Trichonephila clavipes]
MSTDDLVPKTSLSNPEQSSVRRGRTRMSIDHLRPKKSPSKHKQSSFRRGKPRMFTDHLRAEKSLVYHNRHHLTMIQNYKIYRQYSWYSFLTLL